ncbi:MAG TPA: FtsK/SpoIIIE domain-containing protein [Ilumatobacteraceae bacterium]|nr:FtsK/SpoIIIE domain-containing protein [Ilumatobacteraceae bacterium]
MTDHWILTWEAGPDAGGTTDLGHGPHIIGRAAGAAMRCDDPALEPHHLLIEISDEGAVLRQLTGRVPARVDGEPLGQSVIVDSAARVEVGCSVLLLARGGLTAPGHTTIPANLTPGSRGSVVMRRPRAAAEWNPDPIAVPPPQPEGGHTSGGVLPAFLALAGAGLIAVLFHQPMFLLFGAIGGFVAFGTWGGQRMGSVRRRRHETRVHRRQTDAYVNSVEAQRLDFVAHRQANDSTPASARRTVEALTADLWSRREHHADGFTVSLGVGAVAWTPTLDAAGHDDRGHGALATETSIPDLPIMTDIGATCRMAIRGDDGRARAAARSMMVQLAANCGPADVRFVVATNEPAGWRWLEGLPHATTGAETLAVVTEADLLETIVQFDVVPRPQLVVITDAPELLAARTSPLRRVVGERSCALVVLVDPDGGIPHVCTSLLDVSASTNGRWHADAALASLPVQVRCAGISERSARRLVNGLSGLIDPEDPVGGAAGIPHSVGLVSLLPSRTPAAIAAAWVAGGGDPPPRAIIGVAGDGVVDIDLERDGPHALMAGTTGAGKSELLRSLVAGLASASSPDHLTFVLIDYKGGSTFDACARLPHVVGVVTDLDDRLANRALRSLHAELRRCEQLLRAAGAADLAAYRRSVTAEVLPRLVVVIDEFAALVTEQPAFLHALVGIAQRGRSLGVHLILATQRPSGVISDDIRANTNLRLALRVQDATDAIDVVGDRAPATIPRGLAGRAVMRLGPREVLTFQTAHCTRPLADGGTELDLLVDAICDAAVLVGTRPARAPWLPPLPPLIALDPVKVAQGILGVVDDPDGQRTIPLGWDRSGGHLLLVGSAGSGVTSALALLGSVAATDDSGSHVYVIDGRGDPALAAFERSPRCGAVVRLHERERLIRLISRLGDEVARRVASPSGPRNPILVLIDGLDAVRGALDDPDSAAEFELLETILTLGPGNDVVIVGTTDRVNAVPSSVSAKCGQRWLFHLADPLDATGLGVAAADVPPAVPGRIFVSPLRLEAQLMFGTVPLPGIVSGLVPAPVECLPARVDATQLPTSGKRGEDSLLTIGLRFADGEACHIDVPDGEHALIIGPARSGRSTALQRLVMAWREMYPDGWWCTIAPRRTVLDEQHRHRSIDDVIDVVPANGRVLIAVDDAELVEDAGGALARLAAARPPGLLIIATGKPDSLRQSYGHWTGVIRRSRLGIVTAASNDLDGDLLGASIPRHLPIAVRPGLSWLVSDGEVELVQVAVDQLELAKTTAAR